MISYVNSFFVLLYIYIDIIDIMVHYVFFDFLILFPTVASALFRFFPFWKAQKLVAGIDHWHSR